MKIRLTKAIKSVSGGVTRFAPEDASKITGVPCSLFCEVDGNGDPILDGNGNAIYWYFTPDDAPQPTPVPPTAPKDMTDEQIAADPLFQIIKRAEKALRTFGPTSKRPVLDATDKGFAYVDNTLNVTIWWYGTNWRDAMGAVR